MLKQKGFSLIELLIAMGLGLFMLAGIIQVTVGSRQSFDVIRAQSIIQESGRFSMSFISRSSRAAGYLNPGDITTMNGDDYAADLVNLVASNAYWLGQNGFDEGAIVVGADSTDATLTDADTTLDSFTFRMEGDGDATRPLLDCAGVAIDGTPGIFTRMTFYIDTNDQLRCDVAGASSVVLVSGVEDMQVLYGVGNASTPNRATRYLTATQMTSADWPYVVAMQIGLMTLSDNTPLDRTGRDYILLDKAIDSTVTADGRARQVFTQTIAIRSQLSG
ncbi:PilW family protein [Pseudomonadales bacterium]|nr:PilW family protein [Pseudomonadales bacterium]